MEKTTAWYEKAIDIIGLALAVGAAGIAVVRRLKRQNARLTIRLMHTSSPLAKRLFPDSELQTPVRRFEDTFSVFDAINSKGTPSGIGRLDANLMQALRDAREDAHTRRGATD